MRVLRAYRFIKSRRTISRETVVSAATEKGVGSEYYSADRGVAPYLTYFLRVTSARKQKLHTRKNTPFPLPSVF